MPTPPPFVPTAVLLFLGSIVVLLWTLLVDGLRSLMAPRARWQGEAGEGDASCDQPSLEEHRPIVGRSKA